MAEQKSIWQKGFRGGKLGFDKLWGYADRLGAPVNKLTNKIGSEAFWPTSIDKESYKAARILRSFCKDGIYTDEVHQTEDGPKQQQKILKKIPAEVIKNAKGLAIFTTMRTGLWFSGAGGSGIIVARLPDGSWSPPSGILLHTAGIGFLVGVDIYDCVLVLNTDEAVTAFSKWRATVGGEISAVAGPVGVGGILETELHKRRAPIFTYLRSRGFYAGVQIDGTVVIERTDENERFYGYKYSAMDILGGKIRHPPYELRTLTETLKAAQGDTDVDESALPTEPPPADFEVVKSDQVFGVPDKEDPDPYGVLALEKEGLLIKEAGSQSLAPHEEFDFKPALTSPVFATYNKGSQRDSLETSTHRSSWRSSGVSLNSIERSKYVTMESATQTETGLGVSGASPLPVTPEHEEEDKLAAEGMRTISPKPLQSSSPQVHKVPPPLPSRSPDQARHIPPPLPLRIKPTYTTASTSTLSPASIQAPTPQEEKAPTPTSKEQNLEVPVVPTQPASPMSEFDDLDLDDEDDETVEVVEVQQVRARPIQAMRPQMISAASGARVVTVGPRPTPILPSRNPSRALRGSASSGPMTEDGDGASTMASEGTEASAHSLSPTSPERERKESVTSVEDSPTRSITAKSPSVRSARSFRSTHSTVAPDEQPAAMTDVDLGSSDMPGGFPSINEPAFDFHGVKDEPLSRTFSPELLDPRSRISMANMRSGLVSDDEDDARSPSPGPRKFSMIQTPIDDEHMHGQFA